MRLVEIRTALQLADHNQAACRSIVLARQEEVE